MAKFQAGAELIISDIDEKMGMLSKMAAAAAAESFAIGLKAKLTGPRSGRTYQHPMGGSYTASEPGSITAQEYPAERMGDLRESIDAVQTENNRGGSSWAVGSDLDYAAILMEGSEYMVARMFLYKYMLEERDNIEGILGAAFTGDQPTGGRARNPLNVSGGRFGSVRRTEFNRRKEEIKDLLDNSMRTTEERAAISRRISRAGLEEEASMRWHNVMREMRSGKRSAQRFRWGDPI